jgi:hypothetical protein
MRASAREVTPSHASAAAHFFELFASLGDRLAINEQKKRVGGCVSSLLASAGHPDRISLHPYP